MKYIFLTPTLVVITLMLLSMVSSCDNSNTSSGNTDKPSSLPAAKVYVANETGGSVTVIDLQDSLKTTTIDLSDSAGTMFMAHNVQVAPDGKYVWVAAAGMDSSKTNYLIVIDPNTGTIKERVLLGKDLHVAHVVLDNASKNAFVTAGETNQVIQVDATTYQVVRKFDLGAKHAPHGLRYANSKLYVANMDGKSMSVITVADGKVTDIPLGGIAPQVAVTRDDKFVFISLYDTKEVIQYDLKNGQIIRIPLPVTAQGPIQLYATPDSKLLYVADQGELLGRPVSNEVYVIDIPKAEVISTIKVGKKAHGVVVSDDGKSVYVTNTIDNTVSVIDVASQKVIHTIPVGKGPNGISYWFKTGGMR